MAWWNAQDTGTFLPLPLYGATPTSDGVVTQNICFMPQHQQFSVEELRLNDYAHGGGSKQTSTWNPAAFFGDDRVKNGLVPTRGLFSLNTANPPQLVPQPKLRQGKLTKPAHLTTAMITFEVGSPPTPQRFIVHETAIAPRSEFVRLALSRDWKEAKERTIFLPEDDPAAFDLYQHWIYHQRIYSGGQYDPTSSSSSSSSSTTTTTTTTEYQILVKAYILGEKLMDTHFQDAIADCILDVLRTTSLFDARLTNLIYNGTPETSPLRTMLRDVYMWCGSAVWMDEASMGELINADFAVDLSKRQFSFHGAQQPAQAPFAVESCLYHRHVEGVCYKKRAFG